MKRLWDKTARIYPWLRSNPVAKHFLQKEIKSGLNLLSMISTTKEAFVADLAVGRGHSIPLLPNTARVKFAIDKSYTMISLTKPAYPQIQFVQADAMHLPFKYLTYDLILCIGLLEYIPDAHRLLAELYTILKINGYLLLTSTPRSLINHFRILSGHKIYLRHREEIEDDILYHSFRVIGTNYTGSQDQFLLRKE